MLQRQSFGAFTRGVLDTANPELDLTGGLREALNVVYSGGNKLSIRLGTALALTLKDDQGSPASITSVSGVWQFMDGALAIGHSTTTQKVYLYRLNATLDGWYNYLGVAQTTLVPEPVAVLWTSNASAPDVFLAEGLGTAYIAHSGAADSAGLYYPSKTYNLNPASLSVTSITSAAGTATLTAAAAHGLVSGDRITVAGAVQTEYNITATVTVTGTTTLTYAITGAPASPATGTITYTAPVRKISADLDASGTAEDLYFLGCVSFQNHLWAWGFGSGSTTGYTSYRPELARFSQINFGTFSASDSVTVGDRVRSARERIIGAGVAGEVLFLGATDSLSRITGYGRSSWEKRAVAQSYGLVGPKASVTVGGTLYYWSTRGPMRISGFSEPEPLWLGIAGAVASAVNTSRIVAGYHEAKDQVLFAYDTASGVRQVARFDLTGDRWLGPDEDLGINVRAMGSVTPVVASTASAPSAPSAPTSAVTSAVGSSTATAAWTVGDSAADVLFEYGTQSSGTYTTVTLTAGTASYAMSGLSSGTAYQWRVRHLKSGVYSSYLGPSASTQFTTSGTSGSGGGTLVAPSGCTIAQSSSVYGGSQVSVTVSWTNSGESGVSTEVYTLRNGADPILRTTTSPGVSSATVAVSATVGDTITGEVRHVKSGETPSGVVDSTPLTIL